MSVDVPVPERDEGGDEEEVSDGNKDELGDYGS